MLQLGEKWLFLGLQSAHVFQISISPGELRALLKLEQQWQLCPEPVMGEGHKSRAWAKQAESGGEQAGGQVSNILIMHWEKNERRKVLSTGMNCLSQQQPLRSVISFRNGRADT